MKRSNIKNQPYFINLPRWRNFRTDRLKLLCRSLLSQKVFKKFYQVGRSQIRSAQGSGLGLYLVKNIAKAHHGEIKIKANKEEKGTEFILQLPFYTKQPMAKAARKMMGLK